MQGEQGEEGPEGKEGSIGPIGDVTPEAEAALTAAIHAAERSELHELISAEFAGNSEIYAALAENAKNAAISTATSLHNYDTLAQANADLANIPNNGGVNIVADGGNSGFYVKEAGVLVKKSDLTLTALGNTTDALQRKVNELTEDEDIADDFVFAITDLVRQLALAIDRKGHVGLAGLKFIPVSDSDGEEFALPFIDKLGKIAMAITNDGRLALTGMKFLPSPDDDGEEFILPVVDQLGRVSLAITRQGTVFARMDRRTVGTPLEVDLIPPSIGLIEPFGFVSLGMTCGRVTAKEAAAGEQASYIVRHDLSTPVTALRDVAGPVIIILAAGQSLSIGAYAGDAITSTPLKSHLNLMLSNGMRGGTSGPNTPNTDLVPAFEAVYQGWGETMGSRMMDAVSHKIDDSESSPLVLAYRAIGTGGASIADLSKGGNSYSIAMQDLDALVSNISKYSKKSIVPAVTWTHGETDDTNGTARAVYLSAFRTMRNNYEQDVKLRTGQSDPVIMLVDQLCAPKNRATTSEIALAQLDAVETNPELFKFVGPKYWLQGDYGMSDSVHMKALGYALMGEMHAKAWHSVFVDGVDWTGVRPKTVTRTGAVIDIVFHVQVGALAFDTTTILPAINHGFSYTDDSSSASIASVEIVGTDAVRVTLTSTPTGSNKRISYAFDNVANGQTRNGSGCWGNLRDGDETPSSVLLGFIHRNWCGTFSKEII